MKNHPYPNRRHPHDREAAIKLVKSMPPMRRAMARARSLAQCRESRRILLMILLVAVLAILLLALVSAALLCHTLDVERELRKGSIAQ